MAEPVTLYKASERGVSAVPLCYKGAWGGYRDPDGIIVAAEGDIGRTYFLDRTEAALKAEELRLKKIDSLAKQIAKLEAAGPHITLFPHKEQPE